MRARSKANVGTSPKLSLLGNQEQRLAKAAVSN
jgi:hypothetical protein